MKILGELPLPAPAADVDHAAGQAGRQGVRRDARPPADPAGEQRVGQAVHWTFGPGVAGVYGATVEAWPFAGVGYGLGFAVVLWLLTHESTVPALDLSDPPTKASPGAAERAVHALPVRRHGRVRPPVDPPPAGVTMPGMRDEPIGVGVIGFGKRLQQLAGLLSDAGPGSDVRHVASRSDAGRAAAAALPDRPRVSTTPRPCWPTRPCRGC